MAPIDPQLPDLIELREELWRQVVFAFQHPGRPRSVGGVEAKGSDYRRLLLEMLDLLDARIARVVNRCEESH